MPHDDEAPVRITSARAGRSVDRQARQRRYFVTMGIRTACFVVGVVALLSGWPAPLVWLLFLASLFLPYIAVVMANAGDPADPTGGPELFTRPAHPELEGPAATDDTPR
ncbi:MAG: DUF3099 domain-containing protein [Nocardioidaceae bacterium]